ncbi:ABC transporter permease subunit [Streptomyces sp. NPDC023838]|uniref:ABC transporter permease subunit n=1 Tax=Streptomyces sp. NPDC023838 TaxID=3154325 RepID=UPI00340C9ECB
MSTLTRPSVTEEPTRTKPRRLRGLLWLVARQHRAVLLACAAAILFGSAWIIYQRHGLLHDAHAAGLPATPVDEVDGALRMRLENTFNDVASYVGYLPMLFGLFLGAPLLASDHESGTARLVTTQSVPRGRWLLWKLGFALALVAVTTAVLGALLTWYWHAARPFVSIDWLEASIFDNTGPVLLTTALFTTSLGIVIGALVRRAVTAMTLTFFGTFAFSVVFDYLKPHLATPRRVAFPLDGAHPAVLNGSVQVDQWVGTASGKLYGWSTCVSDADSDGCRARKGIVNSVWDYFGYDQMATLQWTAAALLLVASAALLALAVWRTRRQAF